MAGEHLDLSSEPPVRSAKTRGASERRFLGVQFECCGVYSRVYLNREGSAYQGNCPRCALPVRFPVGAGGTNARFFRVS